MIRLGNSQIALTLEPAFGARVTSLTDMASGRRWLVPGDCMDGDAYLGDQARGWDECFPTVGRCEHPAWDGPMRDHGELWGREWAVTHDADSCVASYADPRFAFARSLQLQGGTVVSTYHVTNRGSGSLPYLWSQHCLLATTPADRIVLRGIADIRSGGQPLVWPHRQGRDLSAVGTMDDRFALKLYGRATDTASAGIAGPAGGIRFDWSGADIPALGLWLDYGAWPPGAPVHQVALEPATAAADDLAQADTMSCARHLAPGETHRWSVRITLTPPPARRR